MAAMYLDNLIFTGGQHRMESAKDIKTQVVVEREITIDKARYHIRSVFIGQTTLGDALSNIIVRRTEEERRAA